MTSTLVFDLGKLQVVLLQGLPQLLVLHLQVLGLLGPLLQAQTVLQDRDGIWEGRKDTDDVRLQS